MYSNWSIWPFSEPGFVYFHPQVIKSKHDCYDQLNHCSLIALSISIYWHPFPTRQFNVFFHVSLGKSIRYKEMFIASLMIGKILGEAWGILNLWRHKIWRGTDTDLCSSFFANFIGYLLIKRLWLNESSSYRDKTNQPSQEILSITSNPTI